MDKKIFYDRYLTEQDKRHVSDLATLKKDRAQWSDEERFEKWMSDASDPRGREASETAAVYHSQRIESMKINIYAQTPWAESFAREIQLAENESYWFRKTYTDPISVRKISKIKGAGYTTQTVPHDSATRMDMYFNQSDQYYVEIEHPDWGTWERDMDNQMEAERAIAKNRDDAVKTLLDSGLTTSFTDGTHYKLESSIESSMIPAGNNIDVSSLGITKELFVAIFAHFDRLGRISFPNDRRIEVRRIFVPLDFPEEVHKWVSVVSGFSGGDTPTDPGETIDPTTQRQIFRFGVPRQFFGNTFELVPLETLPSNYLYVSTNKPATILGTKPSQAKSWMLTDRERFNETGFQARVTEGHMQPDPYVMNYAKFQYAS